MKHLKRFNENFDSHEDIPYFDELTQMAKDIKRGKLDYEDDITKKQRNKYSRVPQWWWMKFKGIGPNINSSGELEPRGKCQAKRPYKDKECEIYTDDLYMNEAGHTGDGENLCPPMCSYCYNNWTEIND